VQSENLAASAVHRDSGGIPQQDMALLEEMTLPELKQLASDNGLPTDGLKRNVINHLKNSPRPISPRGVSPRPVSPRPIDQPKERQARARRLQHTVSTAHLVVQSGFENI
jgi:hypothetical protein